MKNEQPLNDEIRALPTYKESADATKIVLTSMQIMFFNLHVTKAVSILKEEAVKPETLKTIKENSAKKITDIFNHFLDNDGSSPAPDIITKIATALCLDYLGSVGDIKELQAVSSKLQFWARRYAEGRQSVVCSEVNELTERLLKDGVACTPETVGDREGSIWAHDGDPKCCDAIKFEAKYGKDGKGGK